MTGLRCIAHTLHAQTCVIYNYLALESLPHSALAPRTTRALDHPAFLSCVSTRHPSLPQGLAHLGGQSCSSPCENLVVEPGTFLAQSSIFFF